MGQDPEIKTGKYMPTTWWSGWGPLRTISACLHFGLFRCLVEYSCLSHLKDAAWLPLPTFSTVSSPLVSELFQRGWSLPLSVENQLQSSAVSGTYSVVLGRASEVNFSLSLFFLIDVQPVLLFQSFFTYTSSCHQFMNFLRALQCKNQHSSWLSLWLHFKPFKICD